MDRSNDEASVTLPHTAPDALGGADLGHALERWAADAAVDEAVRRRIRERWMNVQSEESATMTGTLVDLAERGATVVLAVAGHRIRGELAGIGGDFVAVRVGPSGRSGHDALVRTGAIDVVHAEPGHVRVRGDRSAGLLDVTLDAVVGPVAAERPSVLVRTTGGADVRGELRSSGSDVLTLRVGGDPPSTAWVPLASVTVVAIGV